MAKDGNTYAKRQRETLKRQKAEAKRDRRKKRKDAPPSPLGIDQPQDAAAANSGGETENP
jgi:hypothetical protein